MTQSDYTIQNTILLLLFGLAGFGLPGSIKNSQTNIEIFLSANTMLFYFAELLAAKSTQPLPTIRVAWRSF